MGWGTHRLENNHVERLSNSSESFQPTSGPHAWDLVSGGGAPEHLALKGRRACVPELHGTETNRDPILERCTQALTCTGSQGKAEAPQESGSDPTAVLGGSPGKEGVTVNCCGGSTLEAKLLGVFISLCSSGGGLLGKIWPTPQHGEAPGQTTNQWEHSPTHQQRGCLKTPQAHSHLSSHPETRPHPPEG